MPVADRRTDRTEFIGPCQLCRGSKKHFSKCCLQRFSSEKVLIKHKENCNIINGKQSVKLKSGSVRFKN